MITFFNALAIPDWEFLLRIAAAGIAGGMIGLERSHRQKEAGLRTHVILALGAAVFMLVSKYGFFDIFLEGGRADASRIASNVVTGVSFLCAGVIFVRGGSVKGLTTAAGIWATAGIGLAFGAGMYFVGALSTALILLTQFLLHRFGPPSERTAITEISLRVKSRPGILDEIRDALTKEGISVQGLKIHRDAEIIHLSLTVRLQKRDSLNRFLSFTEGKEDITDYSFSG